MRLRIIAIHCDLSSSLIFILIQKSKSGKEGSYRIAQVSNGDGRRKKSKTDEHGSYHSAEVSPGDRGPKKS